MSDYPDFAPFQISRYGYPQILDATVSCPNGVLTSVGAISGVGYVYLAQGWIAGQVGNKQGAFQVLVDGTVFYYMPFNIMFNRGLYLVQSMFVYLLQYDEVNGNFGIATGRGITFEESFELKFNNDLVANQDANCKIQYAVLS